MNLSPSQSPNWWTAYKKCLFFAWGVLALSNKLHLSIKHNTGVFKIKLCLYKCATCLDLFSGHQQAWQYKNLTKEDVTR